jgi:hypothetical protein
VVCVYHLIIGAGETYIYIYIYIYIQCTPFHFRRSGDAHEYGIREEEEEKEEEEEEKKRHTNTIYARRRRRRRRRSCSRAVAPASVAIGSKAAAQSGVRAAAMTRRRDCA